jgi:Plant transposon protein
MEYTSIKPDNECIVLSLSDSDSDNTSTTNKIVDNGFSEDDESSSSSLSSVSSLNFCDDTHTTLVKSMVESANIVSNFALLIVSKSKVWVEAPKTGGSLSGKAPNKDRDFREAYDCVVKDYFSGVDSIYNELDFVRHFCVTRPIFKRIYGKILNFGLFSHHCDALGKQGIYPLVCTVASFCFLANGDTFDRNDKYLHISETSTADLVKQFCQLIVKHFGPLYLNRSPTVVERNLILLYNKKRGFTGMLASRDCSHFKWDKCPIRYHEAYQSRYANNKTVVLEAVVDCYLWIWSINFANAGSLNEINILDKLSIVSSIWTGKFDLQCPQYN